MWFGFRADSSLSLMAFLGKYGSQVSVLNMENGIPYSVWNMVFRIEYGKTFSVFISEPNPTLIIDSGFRINYRRFPKHL